MCTEEEEVHLLDQLDYILDCDPLIDEVGFIHPSLLSTFKEEENVSVPSPGRQEVDERLSSEPSEAVAKAGKDAFFWSREHKLGISTKYLLPLYRAAKRRFMDSYRSYKIDSSFSTNNEEVVSSFFSEIENEVMKYSRALLLLSSDFGTAWNARKLVISKNKKISISDELHVSALVLSFAPKSENAWSYRRWVIQRVAGTCPMLEDILEKESKIVEKIAEKSKMNYRAWNHRCWLIPFMKSQQVLLEFKTNKNWATLHVADSSCFHYRRKLMSRMLGDVNPEEVKECAYQFEIVRELWKEELDWNELLIRRYIGREALWLHRRYLSVCWMKHFGDCRLGVSGGRDSLVSNFIDNELGLLQDCMCLPDSIFEDVRSQAIYAAAYILWLNREICWPSNINLDEKLGASDLRTLLNKLCPEKTEVWTDLLCRRSL